ncbi:hypothetical protein H1C71_018031, partial [Ictidomys tridecemlineatus]
RLFLPELTVSPVHPRETSLGRSVVPLRGSARFLTPLPVLPCPFPFGAFDLSFTGPPKWLLPLATPTPTPPSVTPPHPLLNRGWSHCGPLGLCGYVMVLSREKDVCLVRRRNITQILDKDEKNTLAQPAFCTWKPVQGVHM